MKAFCIALGTAFLAAGSVQAQLLEQASRRGLQTEPAQKSPLADSFKPYPRTYGGNEGASPNEKYLPGFKTDPKLVGGFELTPNLAIEAGYLSLRDRGFHKMDDDPRDVPGALGTRSFSTYLAGKLTVPVNEQLTAFAKAGVAYSVRKRDVLPDSAYTSTDLGPFVGVGAQYKMNKNTTVSGELGKVGNTAKWGGSNASGLGAKLKLGF
jgi:opacity protein-like surface antigen